jgi:SAM-dependent methyltransferase
MSEFFEKYSTPFDAELRKQVDLLWPREVECLEAHGLREAKTVLDLGTGNGYFLNRLAERHPGKIFTGIESSPSLAGIARRWNDEGKTNMRVMEGSCPLTAVKDRYDSVLARLSLYSMPNREEVLRWARTLLTENGRIAVIDTDDGLKTSWPTEGFWEPFVAGMAREIGPSADRRLGRKLPHLLLKSGFHDVRVELRPWYSSIDLGKKDFSEFWGGTARQMADADAGVFGAGGLEKVLGSVARVAASSDEVALTFMCVVSAGR